MTSDVPGLISRYFDDSLTAEELKVLAEWLRASPDNARQFAADTLLHDRLRNEFASAADIVPLPVPTTASPMVRRRSGGLLIVASSVLAIGLVVWSLAGGTSAEAAVVELNRIIAATDRVGDRTWRLVVDEHAVLNRPGNVSSDENGRPPKASLDNAVLSVRGGGQFVLVRTTPEGPFITGSNGQLSWAVKPDGSVRASRDLGRFNRDLPGHEQSLPLSNLHDGLGQLRTAYEIHVLPLQVNPDAGSVAPSTRLLVAVKKHGFRGPERVEITYLASSGDIREMRFVDMPFGPRSITLRMTLIDDRNLGPEFFDHSTHHAPDRRVELEE